jgi:hypothetical protein
MKQHTICCMILVLAALLALPGCGKDSTSTTTITVPGSSGPVITGVNPTEVKAGDQVRLTGTGFGATQGTSSIMIGGSAVSTVLSWSDTEILAAVPAGAKTGVVVVTTAGAAGSPGYVVVLWTADDPLNVAVAAQPNEQRFPEIIPDGSGGAIVTWADMRGGSDYDVYAQRVDSTGAVQWTADGVVIAAAAEDQDTPRIIPDGSGGAIIAWYDYRGGSYDIYAQRVNSSGSVQWTANGVPLCTAAGDQDEPQLLPDGSGGAFIVWQDMRSGTSSDIYVQRVNSSGAVQWTADGVALSTAAGDQMYPRIIADGSGGAIIAWRDSRSGTFDIYAQRVSGSGAVQWTADGVAIASGSGNQWVSSLVADGSGGAIITWMDNRNGTYDIYAQRVNGSGAGQWTANGVAVSAAAGDQLGPQLIADGPGGAIITWTDYRNGYSDIYAQRVDGSGAAQWAADGVAVCTAPNLQQNLQIISDGLGMAIIVWEDLRSGPTFTAPADIYAQRVNSSGEAQWSTDGIAVTTAPDKQQFPLLVADGLGGAIITWMDFRNGLSYDIYVQGISANGRQ